VAESEKKNPGRTPDKLHRARVEATAFLLARRAKKSQIKRELRRRWPGLSARTIETYLARAREIIRRTAGKSLRRCLIESLAFWESVVSGPDSQLRDRMVAQERLEYLQGLVRPGPELKLYEADDASDGGEGVVLQQAVNILVVNGREEAEGIVKLRNAGKLDAVIDAANKNDAAEAGEAAPAGGEAAAQGDGAAGPQADRAG
jgi:hypothetical protein